MSEAEGSPGFWRTLPGILTGTAAVLTAVTGLIAAVVQVWPQRNEGHGVSATPVINADAVSGQWAGEATDSAGTAFQVALEIRPGCVTGARCGWIRVSHVPCQGALSLHAVEEESYEFNVDDFTTDSGGACTPGAGELLKRLPDDSLLYTTTYEPKASAILRRVQ